MVRGDSQRLENKSEVEGGGPEMCEDMKFGNRSWSRGVYAEGGHSVIDRACIK